MMTFLAPLQNPTIFTIFALIVGLAVGSFLNVVIYRLPKMMEADWKNQCAELSGEAHSTPNTFSLAKPRSSCPTCGHMISATENIPIISWLLLGGKCSACKSAIPLRYPLVEGITALLSAAAAAHFGFSLAALGALFFIWAMVALTFIDFDTQLLPDSITLPLLWLGLLLNTINTYTDLNTAVIGAAAGYLALWSVFWLFKLATGKEGMGYGDFKLLAAIGAWLGWQMLPLTILLSSLVGAIVGITLIAATRHGRNIPIPFGPYLAAAGVIALFFGHDLTAAYLRLL